MLLPLVIAVELCGGIAILLGFRARLVAIVMAGFSVISALLFHQFWINDVQMNSFMKNIAIAGGFFMIFSYGAGAYSLDNQRLQR